MLKDVSTAALVEELSKRAAVKRITVRPYQPYAVVVDETAITEKIPDEGPAVILVVWD